MQEMRERLRAYMTQHRLTYAWLIALLGKKGINVTRSELCDICIGRRVSAKAEVVLKISSEIIEEYRLFYERV